MGTYLAGERTNCLNAFILCFIHRVIALLSWLGKQFYKRERFFSFAPEAVFLVASSYKFKMKPPPYADFWSFFKQKSSSHSSELCGFVPLFLLCAGCLSQSCVRLGLASLLFSFPWGLRCCSCVVTGLCLCMRTHRATFSLFWYLIED